jgi:hypothetical protein
MGLRCRYKCTLGTRSLKNDLDLGRRYRFCFCHNSLIPIKGVVLEMTQHQVYVDGKQRPMRLWNPSFMEGECQNFRDLDKPIPEIRYSGWDWYHSESLIFKNRHGQAPNHETTV